MPTMCALVAQGWLPHSLEKKLNGGPDFAELLARVSNQRRSFTEALIDIGIVDPSDSETIEHLDQHWLGDDRRGWWPHIPNKGEILRQALIRLIESARDRRLPVAIYWICAGHQFQCVFAESEKQATLFVLTPPIPNATYQPASTVEESMWVIANKPDVDLVVKQAALFGGRPTHQDCRPLDAGYDIWEAQVFTEPH